MKRILGGMVVAAALSGSAIAADLGARTYAKAPAVAPVTNWSGLYIGGNLGYGWGSANTDVSFPAEFAFSNTTLGPDRAALSAVRSSDTTGRSVQW